jgi:hypothetical protein
VLAAAVRRGVGALALALAVAACGDAGHPPIITTTGTGPGPTVSVATIATVDPVGLAQARSLLTVSRDAVGHLHDAQRLAFGDAGGSPTPDGYRRLRRELLRLLPADVAALDQGRPGITDPAVGRAWDAFAVVTRRETGYLRRVARARTADQIATLACDVRLHRRYLTTVAAAADDLAPAADGVYDRFGVELGELRRVGVTPRLVDRATALTGWGCTVAQRPLIRRLERARGKRAIVRTADAIARHYRTLERGLVTPIAGATGAERTALVQLRRWAAVEASFMELIARSWRRRDVTRAMTDAAGQREAAVRVQLVRALKRLDINARFS